MCDASLPELDPLGGLSNRKGMNGRCDMPRDRHGSVAVGVSLHDSYHFFTICQLQHDVQVVAERIQIEMHLGEGGWILQLAHP